MMEWYNYIVGKRTDKNISGIAVMTAIGPMAVCIMTCTLSSSHILLIKCFHAILMLQDKKLLATAHT